MRLRHALRVLVLAGALGLGACQAGPSPTAPGLLVGDARTLREGTQRVVLTYWIAQGMAGSYLLSGRATQPDLLVLVRFDQAALDAIRGHLANPSWSSLGTAAASTRALMDYTTAIDMRTPRAGRRRAAAR